MPGRRKQSFTVAGTLLILAVMIGIVINAPTLYRLFCGATGLNGTTKRIDADRTQIGSKTITVRFDTNIDPSLPWRFRPLQTQVTVHLGEQKLVFFEAENLSDKEIVAHATYNVTPLLAGQYFYKIQCFCFTDERLGPHQKVKMPVLFYVDPRIAGDPDAGTYQAITLSYTFFRARNVTKTADLGRFGAQTIKTVGDAARGGILYQERCTACHVLDGNRVGPSLGGLLGRQAGKAPDYDYSPGLRSSTIVWNAQTLDAWLSGPSRFIPGARMPVDVPDPQDRADIIAFLAGQK